MSFMSQFKKQSLI